MFVFCFCLLVHFCAFYFVIIFIFAFFFCFCCCAIQMLRGEDVIRFNVLSNATPTLNHTSHIQPTTTSCTRYTSKSCSYTQPSLSFSCFDGIIMRHTTSGYTYKRGVSQRLCFASFHQKSAYSLLYCLSKVALSRLITQSPLLAELKAFMLRYCSQWH